MNLKQIAGELADVYGPVPDEVELLLELAELRIAAGKLGIKSIVASGRNLVFSFAKSAKPSRDSLFAKTKGKTWVTDTGTVYLKLDKNYVEPETLLAVLKKILAGRQ